MISKHRLISGWLAAASLCFPGGVFGATFVVNTTIDAIDQLAGDGICSTAVGECTLRAAVQEANSLAGTHVITLPAGTYNLTIPGRGADGAMGDLNITSAAAITINGAGPAATIIDANRLDRIFDVLSGSLTLNDLTLQNGDSANLPGGCIDVDGSGTTNVSPVRIAVNRAVVRGCHAGTSQGGGIHAEGFRNVTLAVADTTFMENSSAFGGGICIEPGVYATITGATIAGNSASVAGGGIHLSSFFGDGGMNVANSTIAQNVSPVAGALWTGPGYRSGYANLSNTTISGNNSAGQGAAIDFGPYDAAPRLKNTIVANPGATANCAGPLFITLGHNLEFPGTSCGFGEATDVRADPLLGPLSLNGGATATIALSRHSPAIGRGDAATCTATPVSGRDQRGVSRSIEAGRPCDIGAYELGKLAPFDFDGDGKSDRTVFRPSAGIWYSALSGGGSRATKWGVSTDVEVAADFDGDGKADLTVWRPSTGEWYIVQSLSGTPRGDQWGTDGDIPLAGDVDGDGKADPVIFRPSNGVWYAKKSTGGTLVTAWGASSDIPLLGDFDGDGKADFTIFRPSNGAWYSVLSGGGFRGFTWGNPTDIPIVGDWDGDGRADAGIYRPANGQWHILTSTGSVVAVVWGGAGDVPVSGDHDGDGNSDFIVWRPSTGVWYARSAGGATAAVWGADNDRPVGGVTTP